MMLELLRNISQDYFLENDEQQIQDLIDSEVMDAEMLKEKWLGFPPVTEEQIRLKEQQLEVSLPPSYKEFLMISNGFRFVSPFLDNLFSLDQVAWAKKTEEEWWFNLLEEGSMEIADGEYLVYGDNQDCVWFRPEYFRQSLKVSEWYDGMCVFLNPIIKHGQEWEVLEYATWYPGTQRYRSFKEYLESVHKSNVQLRNK